MFYLIGRCRPVFVAMTVLALLMSMPLDHALAALVDTQLVEPGTASAAARARLLSLLARQEVRVALLQHGINPAEAEARVSALTDREAAQLGSSMDGLPVGGMDVFLALFLTGVAVGLIVALLIAGGIWAGVKLSEKHEAAALNTPPAPVLPRTSAPAVNHAEPWTGKWKVNSGQMAGIWAFKQTGDTIVSTDASDYSVEAKVRGVTIDGTWFDKIGKGHGRLTAVIAEDGLSFNGDSQHWPRAFFTAVKVE